MTTTTKTTTLTIQGESCRALSMDATDYSKLAAGRVFTATKLTARKWQVSEGARIIDTVVGRGATFNAAARFIEFPERFAK